jgi:hypothetical protein
VTRSARSAPSAAWVRTFARMCPSGTLLPSRSATEQNWQPRPQPRVISTAPIVERCRSRGMLSSRGLRPSALRGSDSPRRAASKSGTTISSASPSMMQSINHSSCRPFFSICQEPGPPTMIFRCDLCLRSRGCRIKRRNFSALIGSTSAP